MTRKEKKKKEIKWTGVERKCNKEKGHKQKIKILSLKNVSIPICDIFLQ